MKNNRYQGKGYLLVSAILGVTALSVQAAPTPPPGSPPAPILTGIRISGPAGLTENTTQQYSCTASYSDGTKTVITPVWSTDSAMVSIDGTGLLSAGEIDGDINIKVNAVYLGETASISVLVSDIPLTGLSIEGPTTLLEGQSAEYTCTASYADGRVVTVQPTWSENSAYTAITSQGILTSGDVPAEQNVTITAQFEGQTATCMVLLRNVAPTVTGIQISGPVSLYEGSSAAYTCTASYSDGSSAVITPVWSENSAFASINAGGTLTAGDVSGDQSVVLTSSYDGYSGSYTVTIKDIVVTRITIGGPSVVNEGTVAAYSCTAYYSDGTDAAVTPAWSEDSVFASISSEGLLSAGDVTSDQTVHINAGYGGVTDSISVTVKYVVAMSGLEIDGPSAITESADVQYTCYARYDDGSRVKVMPIWSTDSACAVCSSSGLLSVANVDGNQQITLTASYGGMQAGIAIAVEDVGNRLEIPLSGYEGQTIYTVLWDSVGETNMIEEFVYEPDVFVIENVEKDRWYWFGIGEYDTDGTTNKVHGQWIWM